jgi:TrkA-N domain/RyR domain
MLRLLRFGLSWGLLLFFAFSAFILGLIGWGLEPCPAYGQDPSNHPWLNCSLDVLHHTLLMYSGQTANIPIDANNWPVRLGRLLAQFATYGTVIRSLAELMTARIEQRVIRKKHDHVVICGLGERGRAFAVDRRNAGCAVVAIENAANEALRTFCRAHGIYLVEGDGRDPLILRRAAVSAARQIFILTGDDNENLTVSCRTRDLPRDAKAENMPLIAYVAINHPSLWREIVDSDLIDREDESFEFRPFSLPALAARSLLWNEPIYAYADMMGHNRVHAVLIGFNAYAESLVVQVGRVCVYKNFAMPAITLLDADPAETKKVLTQHLPEYGRAVDIVFEKFDAATDSLDDALLARIGKRPPVTAIFVCLGSDHQSLQAALYVQKAMQRAGRATAPVYVQMTERAGADAILRTSKSVARFGDVISAFGATHEMCRLEFIGGDLEQNAVEIHEDYLETRKRISGDQYGPARAESAQDWRHLRETYREANRRAADHIKAKLASMGAWLPSGTALRVFSGFSFPTSESALGALAELEHRSWCAGAYLDGWKPGARRDNRRKEHDNLVPFSKLDIDTQRYDRDQITELTARLARNATDDMTASDVIRDDLWIGLVGRNHVDTDCDRWVSETLATDVLPQILDRHQGDFITLVTPLAPGLDLTMTRAAIRTLEERQCPHRLLVIESVPENAMILDFLKKEAGFQSGPRSARLGSLAKPDKGPAITRIAAERSAVIKANPQNWIIDLLVHGERYDEDDTARLAGYDRANAYIVEKCGVLIAATKSDAPRKRGGTADALARRKEYVDRSDRWPIGPDRECVLLDLKDRKAVCETPAAPGHLTTKISRP